MRMKVGLPALRVATVLLILTAGFSALIGILENVVRLPPWMQRYAWPLLVVCVCVAAALLHWQSKLGEQADSVVNLSAVTALQVRELRQRFDRVLLQASTRTELVALAEDPLMRTWITQYLIDQVRPGDQMRCDPTERYWAYIALGAIGGRAARRCIKDGLRDDHVFARQGAEEALGPPRWWARLFPRSLRKGGCKTGSAL
jgi:hypothetical protein